MNKYKTFLISVITIALAIVSSAQPAEKIEPGLYAEMKTSKGTILLYLYFVRAPLTVANFVGLAEGKIENKVKPKGVPFYDGSGFHRVIKNFMIQGGSSDGVSGKDVEYTFKDEFHPDLKHDRAGILSMANAGPGTNTNQFFITHKETAWLNNKHSVFGYVVSGQDVVNLIEQGDKIETVKIIRVGKEAEKFDAVKTFNSLK
jgi:peptidyl-prolyl cis-trans isomerase A (cyclophilin A)